MIPYSLDPIEKFVRGHCAILRDPSPDQDRVPYTGGMATAASPRLNGLPSPQEFNPGDTVICSNAGLGGETTWLWELLDQPRGAPDAMVGPTLANATLVVSKEGTYLGRLTVNAGQSDEKRSNFIAVVRFLKSQERLPAAGETTEQNPMRGWAESTNETFSLVDDLFKDSGRLIGQAGQAGLVVGNVLRITATTTIKTSLPGQESVPVMGLASAASPDQMRQNLFVLVRGVRNTNPNNQELLVARRDGVLYGLAGSPPAGAILYVDDSGGLSTTPGATPRQVGEVIRSGGGTYDCYVNGSPPPRALLSIWHFGSNLAGTGLGTVWVLPVGFSPSVVLAASRPVYRQARAGRVSRLSVAARSVSAGESARISVWKNNLETTLSVVLTSANYAAGVVDFDETHAVDFVATDQLEVRATNLSNLASSGDIAGCGATLLYTGG